MNFATTCFEDGIQSPELCEQGSACNEMMTELLQCDDTIEISNEDGGSQMMPVSEMITQMAAMCDQMPSTPKCMTISSSMAVELGAISCPTTRM